MPPKRTSGRPANPIKAMGGTRGALKKTTRKGAYNKRAKKNFRIRRAPFVETKSRTTEDAVAGTTLPNPLTTDHAIPRDDAFYHLDVQPFLAMSQGLGESDMIGNSVYSRYIKMKIEFTFPKNEYSLLNPYRLYVVHGWVKNTTGWTGSNQTLPYGMKANDATYQNVKEFIIGNLKDYFNEREDKLRFIPKHNPNLIIKGYSAVKANRNGALQMPQSSSVTDAGSAVYLGATPKVSKSVTWQVNRKVHYQAGTVQSGQTSFFYPNQSYLPFVVLFTPDWDGVQNMNPAYLPTVRFNAIHYYSDS
ncbi:MAG: hypothetical protein [Circular genetic element sp.]|nr:MAG: hypothetical protein [Circular genetic element sp.]